MPLPLLGQLRVKPTKAELGGAVVEGMPTPHEQVLCIISPAGQDVCEMYALLDNIILESTERSALGIKTQ